MSIGLWTQFWPSGKRHINVTPAAVVRGSYFPELPDEPEGPGGPEDPGEPAGPGDPAGPCGPGGPEEPGTTTVVLDGGFGVLTLTLGVVSTRRS